MGTYYLGSNLAGDIKTVLETIEKDKIGMVAGVPTIITRVLEYPDVDKYDLSSVVFWLSSGAALDDPVREKFRKFLPNALLYELYSSTEAILSGCRLDSVAGKERSSGKKLAGVAVIGIPDPEYQERVTAVVVLKPGETATSEEIMDWCRDKMAGFKRPRRVDFVDELPSVGADKVDKKVIREWYWKGEKFKV